MKCPKCNSDQNGVIDTTKYNTVVSRVRYCDECSWIWSTKEAIDKDFNHKRFNKKAKEQDEDQTEIFGSFPKKNKT